MRFSEASGDRLNFFKMLQIFGLLIEQNKVEGKKN